MASKIFSFVVFAILGVTSSGQQSSEDESACALWKQMAQQLSHQKANEMTCYSNTTDPCTSLHCTGTYMYTSWVLPIDMTGFEVDYCFGMTLNHCDNPVSIDIYLQVPAKNVSYQRRVSHDTQLQVPGLTFSYGDFGTVDVFLHFHMVRVGNKLTLSITCKLRITSLGASFWPDHLQKVIVPQEQIPVPSCPDTTRGTSAPQVFRQCRPPRWVPLPTTAVPKGSPVVSTIAQSVTHKKYCNDTQHCGRWEVCSNNTCICQMEYTFKNGRCHSPSNFGASCSHDNDCNKEANEVCTSSKCSCSAGYRFNSEYQLCKLFYSEGEKLTFRPDVIPRPATNRHAHVSGKAPEKKNKLAIIAGSVTGGVVLLAIVLVVIFLVRRKQRQPYNNRELLLSPSDDTDVVM
ncbi:uncharacterized protein LOC121373498 [Gigantopelta aegis]|uniref:uncharacterized protein LOC121373498 n=1 Tax=Gigantopelta aegis TaxID=1735272 RepID=UPI001B8891D4|nr:uncharacterized protein LOC121373498 [Gigantopelta aegis]